MTTRPSIESFAGGAFHLVLGSFVLATVAATLVVGVHQSEVSPRSTGFAAQQGTISDGPTFTSETTGEARRLAVGRHSSVASHLVEPAVYVVDDAHLGSALSRGLAEANTYESLEGRTMLDYAVLLASGDVSAIEGPYRVVDLR